MTPAYRTALLLLYLLPAAAGADLAEVRALAAAGTPGLALRVLERDQPDAAADAEAWMDWERERAAILAGAGRWADLAARLAHLPAGLPPAFVRWARTQRAGALVKQGRGEAARRVLRGLIWSGSRAEGGETALRGWRRLVIESYLAEGRMEDARTAMVRFRLDYGEGELADVLLRARILLMGGRAAEAARLLAPRAKVPEAGLLYLLAQLRSGQRPAKRVLQAALRQMRGEWARKELLTGLWAVAAEAALEAGDRATAARALERVLVLARAHPPPPGLFAFNADSLWHAYLDYARHLGNRAQYLIGDDAVWLKAAAEAAERTPVRARSLYAMVLRRGQDAAARGRAAAGFLATLDKARGERRLLWPLFMESRHYPSPAQVPLAVRHALVDEALARSRIEQASRIMATTREPPPGADRFMWHLRRARILVMGGQPGAGAEALAALLDEAGERPREALDKLMQVVFDLQAVGAHEEAVAVLEKVLARTADEELRREVYYWMADSRRAQGRFDEAARLYLRSAMLRDPKAADPWGQTARYQAAGALARAGLVADARTLLEALLRSTEDPARRAVLRRDLQRLLLVRERPGGAPAPAPSPPAAGLGGP